MKTPIISLILLTNFYACTIKNKDDCRFLIDKSELLSPNAKRNICRSLDSLSLTGSEITVYLNDTLPAIIDEIKIRDDVFDRSDSVQRKAIIFIEKKSLNYDIHYSEFIRENDYLRERHQFQTAVYRQLKSKIDEFSIINIATEFGIQFGQKKGF